MSWTIEALLALLVLGLAGGVASEQVAKRKFWPPLGLIGALLVGFGGAVVGAWFFGDILKLPDPALFGVPVIGAVLGALLFLAPYFAVRGGYTPYGRERTWQRKYRR